MSFQSTSSTQTVDTEDVFHSPHSNNIRLLDAILSERDASTGLHKAKDINDYAPKRDITAMHNLPRFGHSNRIGKVSSAYKQDQWDYANGIKDFQLFLFIVFVVWGLILVWLKSYGIRRAGCAAGGGKIDILRLSKEGIRKHQRKRRILRSWRLQSAFLVFATLIPAVTIVLVRYGLSPLEPIWSEIEILNNDIKSWSFRGQSILTSLQKDSIAVQEMSVMGNDSKEFNKWCTHEHDRNSTEMDQLIRSMESLNGQVSAIKFMTREIPFSNKAVDMIGDSTKQVDDIIEWSRNNDWKLKLILMAVNVVNALLLGICYVFSKNNIIHAPTRFYTAYVLLPLFIFLSYVMVFFTSFFGVVSTINADFCAGGEHPGSPVGSIEDAIMINRFSSLSRSKIVEDIYFDSIQYYTNGCLGDSPLGEHVALQDHAEDASNHASFLSDGLSADENNILLRLSSACKTDLSDLPDSLSDLSDRLGEIENHVSTLMEWTACHEISPLARRITHGVMCEDSSSALTCIWLCLLSMSTLAFAMLSTRAALFNGLVTKRRKKQKPANIVKEFEEYKEYMAEFYDDTDRWQMQPERKEVQSEVCSGLESKPTFDTQSTGPLSPSELSHALYFDEFHDERVSEDDAESDYSSSCDSDGSSASDDDFEEESLISTIFSETESFARRTMLTLSKLPSLLRRNGGDVDSVCTPESPYPTQNQSNNGFDRNGIGSPPLSIADDPEFNSPSSYLTVSKILRNVRPYAPEKVKKAFQRTTPDELESLIQSNIGDDWQDEIEPRQLSLASPSSNSERSPLHRRRNRGQSLSPVNRVEPPEAPQKASKRIGRTSATRFR